MFDPMSQSFCSATIDRSSLPEKWNLPLNKVSTVSIKDSTKPIKLGTTSQSVQCPTCEREVKTQLMFYNGPLVWCSCFLLYFSTYV